MAITFDQYQRYKTIQIIVEMVKSYYNIVQLNILEVGANEQLNLEKFLPNENITYSDLSVPHGIDNKTKFIEADATNLKNIGDDEFDIVVSADVFEHIPKSKRSAFLKETSRVAKLLNINCFPFHSEAVKSSELSANEYYKAIFGQNHIWLSEHIDNGLPEIDELKNILKNMNKGYFMFEHGDVLLWEEMTKSTFYSYCTPELICLQDKIDDFYKKNIFINDVGEKNYRKFIVIANDLNLNSYLDSKIKNVFNGNLSERYLNFLYKNIQGMRAIAQLPMNKNKIEQDAETTLYLDSGNGFDEELKIKYNYKLDKSAGNIDLFVNVPENVRSIRFDPIEGKASVLNGLNIISNIGYIDYNIINGFYIDNYIVFNDSDPQIIINCLEQPIEWLKIQANISAFDYSSAVGILNKLYLITKKNEENIRLNELMVEKENYIKELNNRLQVSEKNYNVISNSACWKITKPIRIILDSIKSNKYLSLFCKWLRYFNQNGRKVTLNKVKQKIKNNKGYRDYVKQNTLSEKEKQNQINTIFTKDIKFSIVVPLYNTPKKFLDEMIESCINQTYHNWELCLADGSDKDHNYVAEIVRNYIEKDKRIKYNVLEKNNGISENTNECIKMATGEYIALFDHDDILHPSALFEYMRVICDKNADFIYCDEDKFDKDINVRFDPYFKPDFAIDNLRSNNYICHFTVFKKTLLNEVGLFRKEFDGSQDHDMILRLTEKAKNVVHIPKILYHWRVSSNSVASDPYAKPYTIQAGIHAVTQHLKRYNLKATVESSAVHPNFYRIKYKIIGEPLISILIPNKDHTIDLSRCINSILEKSTYKNIEIIIIENNSTEQETFEYYKTLVSHRNIKIVTYQSDGKFNYSAINNFGVTYANGEHLLFLNNDIEVISENWLEEMLMYSQREDVGAIGAKLYYPNGTIQHAGVILGIGGVAGHSHKYFDRKAHGYFCRCEVQQNLSAVTAACLMMKKSVFNEINGFDECFEVAFNDVDLCMRVRQAGYLIVWTPYAELYHYESISRGYEDTPEKQERFKGEITRFKMRWGKELGKGDPYYNPNLTLDKEDFSLR